MGALLGYVLGHFPPTLSELRRTSGEEVEGGEYLEVFEQALGGSTVIRADMHAAVDTEAGVPPGAHFLHELGPDLTGVKQELEHLGAEQLDKGVGGDVRYSQ